MSRGLIRNNLHSLSLFSRPQLPLRLVKSLDFQTSIELTPCGPLVSIGSMIF
jgi:hypothetical protein